MVTLERKKERLECTIGPYYVHDSGVSDRCHCSHCVPCEFLTYHPQSEKIRIEEMLTLDAQWFESVFPILDSFTAEALSGCHVDHLGIIPVL